MSKTLFERLKPEVLEKLESNKKNYPMMVEEIFYELKNLHFFTDVKYGIVKKIELLIEEPIDFLFN